MDEAGGKSPVLNSGKRKGVANLKPWKPGQSGNPAGRPPAAGTTLREWLNVMQDWSPGNLSKIVKDKTSPAAKKAAARVWLHAISEAKNKVGTPIAGAEFDRVADYTDGKPRQSVEVSGPNGGPIQQEMKQAFDWDAYRRAKSDLAGAGRIPASENGN